MALFHHQPFSFNTPSQRHDTDYSTGLHDDTWSAPMAPGVFDLDPCAPSPVKMAFDFQPLQYECKQLGQEPIPPSAKAPHAPHLMSVEWSSPGGPFGAQAEHIEDVRDETLSPMPVSAASPLLRAPRLRTMPLLMSHPCSPVPYVDELEPLPCPTALPPLAGTRPPLPPRFSVLGLDLTSVPSKELPLPSPPPSPSAGRGRRRRRAGTLEVGEEGERGRGRTRERRRRTEDDDDLPGLTYSGRDDDAPSSELRARVETWCGAVAAATHSQPSTPPDNFPIAALPAYDEAQLAQALGRLNADARSPTDSLLSSEAEHRRLASGSSYTSEQHHRNIKAPRPQRPPMRSQTSFPPQQAPSKPQRPAFQRALSLQLEQQQRRQQQELSAQLDPWAQRVGRARGRRVDLPRCRASISGPSDKRGAI